MTVPALGVMCLRFAQDPNSFIGEVLTPYYDLLWGIPLVPAVLAKLLAVTGEFVTKYMKKYLSNSHGVACSEAGVLVEDYMSQTSPLRGHYHTPQRTKAILSSGGASPVTRLSQKTTLQ